MPVEQLEPWAARLARELRAVPREVRAELDREAQRLATTTRKLAPRQRGRLAGGIRAEGPSVVSEQPYAELQSRGGTVRALHYGRLTIPIRAGYRPGPGYVTLASGAVLRSGSLELYAVRRAQVTIRGSRFLDRALDEHLEHADERMASILPDVEGAGDVR